MNAITFAGLLLVFVILSVWAALRELRRLVGDPSVADRVPPFALLLSCFALAAIASIGDGAWSPVDIGDFGLAILVVWATITAFIDRATAWVTDLSVIFIVVGAFLHDPSISILGQLFVHWFQFYHYSELSLLVGAVSTAFLFWLTCLLLFKVQMMSGRIIFTAADSVAVVLPLFAFGFSYWSSMAYALAACMILLAQRFDVVQSWLSDSNALREGLDDLGQIDVATTRALPAFAVFAPATASIAVVVSFYVR